MKLSNYAKKVGVGYKTAWNWYKAGNLEGYKTASGTIIITELDKITLPQKVAIYARAPYTNDEKTDTEKLNKQLTELKDYCNLNGWSVNCEFYDKGSGNTTHRKGLLKLLADASITKIVIKNESIMSITGFAYIEALLKQRGCFVKYVECSGERRGKNEWYNDLIRQLYLYCTRYGGSYAGNQLSKKITQLINENLS